MKGIDCPWWTHLGLIGELDDQSAYGEGRLIDEVVIDALGPEISGKDAAVGGEPRDGDPDVVVDLEDLPLVGR